MPNLIVKFEDEAGVKLVLNGTGLKAPHHSRSTPESPPAIGLTYDLNRLLELGNPET